jgi:hypothetical protein
MLAKVVDGTSGPESAAEKLVILVVDGKHLVFILALQRWHTCGRVANMQEYFSFLWKLGGGFKDVAVTTTYVDNITGLRWSCSGTAGPAVGPATPPAKHK